MCDFHEIFSVRPQEPQHFLPTRFAGLATLLTSGNMGIKSMEEVVSNQSDDDQWRTLEEETIQRNGGFSSREPGCTMVWYLANLESATY
jgi:hypothetical protein